MKLEVGKKYKILGHSVSVEWVLLSDVVDRHGQVVLFDSNGGSFRHRRPDELTEVPTFVETWTNQYPRLIGIACRSAEAAARIRTHDCIGVSHIHPDGTHTMEDPE